MVFTHSYSSSFIGNDLGESVDAVETVIQIDSVIQRDFIAAPHPIIRTHICRFAAGKFPASFGGMQKRFNARIFLIPMMVVCAGCQTSVAPSAQKSAATFKLHINSSKLVFIHPETGHVFSLHLGEALTRVEVGLSEVPPHMKMGQRDATSSYYEPTDRDGAGYAAAESLYSRDQADRVVRNTEIQYQPETRRLLITEDKSDGRPCRRYILYTQLPRGGYKVTYLSPMRRLEPDGVLPSSPPDIRLLPNDRAEIAGKVIKVDDIDQSPHPFSVGG